MARLLKLLIQAAKVLKTLCSQAVTKLADLKAEQELVLNFTGNYMQLTPASFLA